MASASDPKSSSMKVREHRKRLREQGLRPIRISVPEVRSPAFRTEAHRQSLADMIALCKRKAAPPADLALWDTVRPVGQEVW